MKLAEALVQRSDLQNRLSQLRLRLARNAKVQEGEKPAEDPELLLKELDEDTAKLEELIFRINLTNSLAKDGEETMTQLLARRDCLRQKTQILRDFLAAASETVMRGTRSEVVIKSTVSVRDVQKQVDELSKELRELDIRIQSLNWSVELI